ncbi:hypothetical protein ACIBQ7_00515, partial [Streptomyces massasporeus]
MSRKTTMRKKLSKGLVVAAAATSILPLYGIPALANSHGEALPNACGHSSGEAAVNGPSSGNGCTSGTNAQGSNDAPGTARIDGLDERESYADTVVKRALATLKDKQSAAVPVGDGSDDTDGSSRVATASGDEDGGEGKGSYGSEESEEPTGAAATPAPSTLPAEVKPSESQDSGYGDDDDGGYRDEKPGYGEDKPEYGKDKPEYGKDKPY